jgi:NADPH:quinone reductase-like Zn-dependent oxidoreductase
MCFQSVIDVAGVVDALDDGITDVAVGDRVVGWADAPEVSLWNVERCGPVSYAVKLAQVPRLHLSQGVATDGRPPSAAVW